MNKQNKIICYTVIICFILINLILPYIVVGLSDNSFRFIYIYIYIY